MRIVTQYPIPMGRGSVMGQWALSSVLHALKIIIWSLHRDPRGVPFDESFHYRSIIGKLNFLEKSTCPELAYAVHQCACICPDPKHSHGEAVKPIGRYLLSRREQGIILTPKQDTVNCWVNASHAGEWKKETASNDEDMAKSRTGYLIMFAGCPLIWSSKLQTDIALSSTQVE